MGISAKTRIENPLRHNNNAGVPRLLLVVGILILILSSVSVMAAMSDETPYKQGELIVQLFEDSNMDALTEQFKDRSLRPVRLLSRRMHIWLFEYTSTNLKAADNYSILEAVRVNPEVALAQFNHFVTERQTIPNDPSFGLQWGLNNTGQSGGTPDADIDAPEAWDLFAGDTTLSGDQIVIAIVDGGVDLNHPDIDYFKNLLETPNNGIDDDGNGYIDDYDGWNAYNNNGNVPSSTHGTHVSGIAGAVGNNALGVSGVNWGAQIMPIGGSSGTESVVVAAYGYVHEMRSTYNETNGAAGAFVVSTNSSFGVDYGNPANYPIWCAMYDSMGAIGILSAAATANIGMNIDVQGDVPTACGSDWLISVTNTTRNDVRNSGAAYGLTTIDLGAPGTSIYSTVPGGAYSNLTGTSMATPHVAGAVAFMYSGACATMLSDNLIDPGAVALQIKQNILDGTDPLASLAGMTVSGGRLNLYNSLLLTMAYPCGLLIAHDPLTDTKDAINPYEVLATITSDAVLIADSLQLHYRTGGAWTVELMLPTGSPNEYNAFIPAQSPGTVVEYFIFAGDDGGMIDSTGIYTFRVIDYQVLLNPAVASDSASVSDTASYMMVLTNDGTLPDEYGLTYSGNFWDVSIWDETGSSPLAVTGTLQPNDTLSFMVRVVVPTGFYGDVDTAFVKAASFGDVSVAAISTLVTTSLGAPLSIPFSDTFPTTTVDITKWQLVSNVEINSVGLNEPTPDYSLNLDGTPVGRDTLMSHRIDLSGLSDVTVSYRYEQTGGGESPDNNDDLFVEYLDSLGNWILLSQHLGSGSDMNAYLKVEIPLPGEAYYGGFRLRIRNQATQGLFDDWFVDDVFVGVSAICGDIDGDGAGPNVADLTYLVAYLFQSGPVPPNLWAADVFGDGEIIVNDLTFLVSFLFQSGPSLMCQ